MTGRFEVVILPRRRGRQKAGNDVIVYEPVRRHGRQVLRGVNERLLPRDSVLRDVYLDELKRTSGVRL